MFCSLILAKGEMRIEYLQIKSVFKQDCSIASTESTLKPLPLLPLFLVLMSLQQALLRQRPDFNRQQMM